MANPVLINGRHIQLFMITRRTKQSEDYSSCHSVIPVSPWKPFVELTPNTGHHVMPHS